MSSRIFRLFIILSFTLFAYSCGEDNPVVDPPENPDSLRIVSITPKYIMPKMEVVIKYTNKNKKHPIEKIFFGEYLQAMTSINDSIIKVIPNSYINLLDSFKIKLVNKSGYAESQFIHFFSTRFDTSSTPLNFDVYSILFQPIDGYAVTEGDVILLKCSNLFANTPNSVTVTMNDVKANVASIFVKENYFEKFNYVSVIVPKLTPGAININLTDFVNEMSNSGLRYSEKTKLIKNLKLNLNNIYYNGKYYHNESDKDREPILIDTIKPITFNFLLNEQNISKTNVSNDGNDLDYKNLVKKYRYDEYVNSASEDILQVKIQLSQNYNLISSIFLSRNYKSNYQMSGNGGLGNEDIYETIRLKNIECTYNSANNSYKVLLNGESVKNVLSSITSIRSSYDKKLFWSRTLKTSYISMLSYQPPEATIEISLELY